MLTPSTGWKLQKNLQTEHKKQSAVPNQGWTDNWLFWLSWQPYFLIKLLSLLFRKTEVLFAFHPPACAAASDPYPQNANVFVTRRRGTRFPRTRHTRPASGLSLFLQLGIPIPKHSPEKMSIFVENKHQTTSVISYNRDDEAAHLTFFSHPPPPLPTFTLNQPPIKL